MKFKFNILVIPFITMCILIAITIYISTIEFKIIGNNKIVIEYNDKYSESGYKLNVMGKNVSSKVKTSSNLKKELGIYKINYSYKFLCFNYQKSRQVQVVDNTRPEIELTNGDLVSINEGDTYTEPGYTATDNYDGNLTNLVKVEGNVDTSQPGEYIITYEVSDSSNNSVSVQRKVVVNKKVVMKKSSNYSSTSNINYEKYNETVIVGDSNIKNLYLHGYANKGNAWAYPCLHPMSMKTEKIYRYGTYDYMTLYEALEKYQPKRLILYMGTFSTTWISEQEFDDNAQEVINQIKSISPNTELMLLSLLPITGKGANVNNFSQDKIDYYNKKIATLAQNNSLRYINVQEIYKTSEGLGDAKYYVSDGFHLNEEGHRIFRDYIAQVI